MLMGWTGARERGFTIATIESESAERQEKGRL